MMMIILQRSSGSAAAETSIVESSYSNCRAVRHQELKKRELNFFLQLLGFNISHRLKACPFENETSVIEFYESGEGQLIMRSLQLVHTTQDLARGKNHWNSSEKSDFCIFTIMYTFQMRIK